jgi:RNA polymerase sigma-70 factor (ECF subfamily)
VESVTGDAAGRVEAAGTFDGERRRLFGLAYRLLGSAADAEDILGEAFAQREPGGAGEGPDAGLTKAVIDLCLTQLTAARQRRERYTGTWLPEPVLTGGGELGPLQTGPRRESVSMGMLLLLEELTPAERAVFILSEAFGRRPAELARLLDRPEEACRQLARRAAQRVRDMVPGTSFTPGTPDAVAQWRRLADRFLAAGCAGDVAALEELLAEDIVSWSDNRGGEFPTAPRPIRGRPRVSRLFAALRGVSESGVSFTTAEVNGSPALLAWRPARLVAVVVPEVGYDSVRALYTVASPGRLKRLARQAASVNPFG